MQLGKDMYEVDQKALDAAFRREREREARDRLLTNKEGGEDGEDEDSDAESDGYSSGEDGGEDAQNAEDAVADRAAEASSSA